MSNFSAKTHNESVDLAMAQAELCIVKMGQTLMDPDVTQLEQHAQSLLQAITAAKNSAASESSSALQKNMLQKSLVQMSLQLQQQRQLLMRKSSMVDRQLDTLLPPTSRLTYENSKGLNSNRLGARTSFKA